MDEKRRNSMKLDIEAVRLSENDHDQPNESYKPISEFNNSSDKFRAPLNANMVREKNVKSENIEDGADEKMLDGDDKQQLARKDEVKFIASDRSNGDAKIDIGQIEKNFTGMTKEELMKYVNDPFWIRLRWIFFITFWLLWVVMLAGAIWIIFKAPKCSAPEALVWYKEGPLVQLSPEIKRDQDLIENLKSFGTKGVIFSLPADKTYSIQTDETVKNHIKELVDDFKNTSMKVILDLTPNFVTTEDDLYKQAMINETYRSAFVWLARARNPNNWLSKVDSGSAWKEVKTQNYVLSQFGPNNIDLQLNDTIAKEKFKQVLRNLIEMGVKGFRLANAKHYIIDKTAPDDGQSSIPSLSTVHTDYRFWTHSGTTFQPGVGQLLNEFADVVEIGTKGEGFLSVTDNIVRPDIFKNIGGKIGFELPIISALPHTLTESGSTVAKKLKSELNSTFTQLGDKAWVQWPLENPASGEGKIGISEYNIFLFLLPGVPVGTLDQLTGSNNTAVIKALEKIRKTQSFQHGSFEVYTENNDTIIAYSRLRSGNPGYFVVYNPTDNDVYADFSSVKTLPDQLTLELASQAYKHTQKKVSTISIPLSPRSVVVLSYALIKK